ncbi:helix-turn-helix domain-containing protein [Propionivibrio sp.]|uniref:helix-turn-helix domain-containing protein n=1 Tax=Propionivibrio sp. TaxID=2212460 RepID=UPI003BF44054
MDRRRKHIDPEIERELRIRFYEDIKAGKLPVPEAVREMRRLSRLTQPEFAKHRGVSFGALKQIEAGDGNPTIATLQKIGTIFGLEVGFVLKPTTINKKT